MITPPESLQGEHNEEASSATGAARPSTPGSTPEQRALLDLLSEWLTLERDGIRLYQQYESAAPEDARVTLAVYRAEIARHVSLLEQTITDLGGEPSYVAPLGVTARRLTDALLELDQMVPPERRGMYHLEALLVFETRDQLLWEMLAALARHGSTAAGAGVLRRAADDVQSVEALGAGDAPRHEERLRWIRAAMQQLVLTDAGLAGVRDAATGWAHKLRRLLIP